MKVIVGLYEGGAGCEVFTSKDGKSLTDVMRQLWEHQYNSYDGEFTQEDTWFEEDQCQLVDHGRYVAEYKIIDVREV